MPEYCDIFYSFKDLEDLPIRPKPKITSLQFRFLKYFISHTSSSAYDIFRDNFFRQALPRQTRYYDSTSEVVRRLLTLNLIVDTQQPSTRGAIKCKLSSSGIYFLISSKILSFDQMKSLIENYTDFILFQLFLYPYVTSDTLLKIQDSFIFSRIALYLSECFEKIEDTINHLSHTYNQKNGNLTQPLFTWENVPKEDYETERLRQFLKKRFHLDWLEKAEIKKSENLESITISYGMNSALIKLNNERTEAILTNKGTELYHFIVRRVGNQTIIDIDEFLMPGKESPVRISLIETYLIPFIIFQQARIIDLIFSLFSAYGASSAATQVLAEDENFQEALEKTKRHFEQRYNIFTKKSHHSSKKS
jgi:hypothetical protein